VLFGNILAKGFGGLIQGIIMVTSVFFFTWWLATKMNLGETLKAVMATAVSICGVSAAIAAAHAGRRVLLAAPRPFPGEDLCSTLRLWLESGESSAGRLTAELFDETGQTTPISADDFNGRYVYYGVREHAMAAVMTPMTSPICWRFGVAPTRWPVFRSCDVSPAIAAAMQTIAPIVSTVTLASRPTAFAPNRSAQVSTVAIVMPDVGLEVTPTRPTIRDETVTKKNAKIVTSRAARILAGGT